MSDDNINTETTIIPPVDSSSTSTSSTSPSLTSSSTSLSITSTSPSSITSTSTSLSTSTLAPVSENNSTFAPSPSKKLFPGFDSTPLVAPVSKPAPPPDEGQDSPAKGHQRDKLSGLTRCFNPPKLERKHSSGDLQSRLKTRKILGVGETDNGDIHRSKISQVLGHNEHLYVRFPKGMWATHVLLGVLITIEALVLLLVPSLAGTLGLIPSHVIAAECPMASLRLIGAALSGLALFVWAVLGTTDKHYERTALLALVVYNSLCVGISVGSTLLQGTLCRGAVAFCVGLRTSLCFLCLAYFQQIGEPWSGLPKSSSYKELTKEEYQSRLTPLSSTKTPGLPISAPFTSSTSVFTFPPSTVSNSPPCSNESPQLVASKSHKISVQLSSSILSSSNTLLTQSCTTDRDPAEAASLDTKKTI